MTSIIPKITNISSRVTRILGCNPGPMTLQGTNTYLIGTGKRRILLDTGEGNNSDYIAAISSLLSENDVTVNKVVLSHWHLDHVGGVNDVLNICKEASVHKMKRMDEQDDAFVSFKPLKDQEEICVEGATLRVHYTPGHTSDHAVFELREENAIFSGDCILGEGTAVFEDLHTYMGSLHAILKLNPDVIYPGHGPVISEPIQKIQLYIDHRNQREQQIVSALKSCPYSTTQDLVKVIYKDTPEHLHWAAEVNVKNHLGKLLKDDIVSMEENNKWQLKPKRMGQL